MQPPIETNESPPCTTSLDCGVVHHNLNTKIWHRPGLIINRAQFSLTTEDAQRANAPHASFYPCPCCSSLAGQGDLHLLTGRFPKSQPFGRNDSFTSNSGAYSFANAGSSQPLRRRPPHGVTPFHLVLPHRRHPAAQRRSLKRGRCRLADRYPDTRSLRRILIPHATFARS